MKRNNIVYEQWMISFYKMSIYKRYFVPRVHPPCRLWIYKLQKNKHNTVGGSRLQDDPSSFEVLNSSSFAWAGDSSHWPHDKEVGTRSWNRVVRDASTPRHDNSARVSWRISRYKLHISSSSHCSSLRFSALPLSSTVTTWLLCRNLLPMSRNFILRRLISRRETNSADSKWSDFS